jgi:hypothetical protein
MARKTKLELAIERQAEREAELVIERAEYPGKLRNLLERAISLECQVELLTKEDDLGFSISKPRCQNYFRFSEPAWISWTFTPASEIELNSLSWLLDSEEQDMEERRKAQELRKQAISKLTDEERKVLGLS